MPWQNQPRKKGKFDYKNQSESGIILVRERPQPTETDPAKIIKRTYSEYHLDVWDNREHELAAAYEATAGPARQAAVKACRDNLILAPKDVLIAVGHVNEGILDQASSRISSNRGDLLDTSYAAGDAATNACNAIALRDRIGEIPGWEQAAYDLVTRPWRTVIGELHPDDNPLS